MPKYWYVLGYLAIGFCVLGLTLPPYNWFWYNVTAAAVILVELVVLAKEGWWPRG